MELRKLYTVFSCLNVILIVIPLCHSETKQSFLAKRKGLLQKDYSHRTGADISLTAAETKVNSILMKIKTKEIIQAKASNDFPPASHFFHAKNRIEKSDVFKIIEAMPKGAALHLHDTSMVSVNWLVNVTYRPNCYICFPKSGSILFHFFEKPPPNPSCPWILVSEARAKYGNTTAFDEMLHGNLTMVTDKPEIAYPTIDVAWKAFLHIFDVVGGLVLYAPVFRDYYYQALTEFYEDNVQYMEVRCLLPEVYELNGTTHSKDWVVNTYKEVATQFVQKHRDFVGAKTINSAIRILDKPTIGDLIKLSMDLRKKYPEHFLGFDLVGQEDPNHPLLYYLDELLYPSQQQQQQQNNSLYYFFHAGETNWEGLDVDENIIDALLLNTSRIGHGYAISKHPEAMKIARQRGIPIEVCPISNQVLELVSDLRNHPAAGLMAEGFPMVISSDDPAIWGAAPLSHDFYQAFMALGGAKADLATLKKLAMDSLRFSILTAEERDRAMRIWTGRWDQFINNVLAMYLGQKPEIIQHGFR